MASKKSSKDVVKAAENLMKDLVEKFGLEAESSIEMSSYENSEGEKEEFIDIKIDGEDLGILIGYMGKNLRALQKVFGLILNRSLDLSGDDFVRVVIDVAGYRENRKDSLESMAKRVREEVLASGDSVDLPPMSGFERRVIHVCLDEHDDVTTESFGEGKDRYVRVMPV